MRFVRRFRLALVGLALAVPTSGAWAQGSNPVWQGSRAPTTQPMHICPSCLAKLQANGGAGAAPAVVAPPAVMTGAPVVMAGGDGCAACQAQASNVVMPPGHASVGSGNVVMAPGYATVGGPAPGYAVVGGPVPAAEPAPIGVMGTNYQTAANGAGMPPGRASTVDPSGVDPALAMNGRYSNTLSAPRHRRPHIITHLFFGRSLGSLRDEQIQRAKMRHASIPYGDGTAAPVTELPASMVYGK
jgi:hypothetical protein